MKSTYKLFETVTWLPVLVYAIVFLLIIQSAGTLVESVYILDLLNSRLDEKAAGVLFFFLPFVPVLFISAMTGQRVSRVLPHVVDVNEARYQRIGTSDLNKFMREAITQHPPPGKGGRRSKFFYATQASVAPPTFVFFVNNPEWVNFGYKRYLENRLREQWPFTGVPIRLFFRARSEDRFGK